MAYKIFWLLSLVSCLLVNSAAVAVDQPNIVLIYADDLGYGELGCYGQELIRTPNMDKLAAQGMRFTQHYSGSPVCAPSRCVLMTGLDSGHAYIRNNSPWARKKNPHNEGQAPLKDSETTVAELLQQRGYRTGVVGKWGLGGPTTEGTPNRQGFDYFFGYHCQWMAHSYYPAHLWKNDRQVSLNEEPVPGHTRLKQVPDDWFKFEGGVYAPQVIADKALAFIEDASKAKEPFFLWYATVIPHVSLHIPSKHLEAYKHLDDDKPYLGQKGYSPHPRPRAAYAAMITYLDTQIGRIIDQLEQSGVCENTLIIVTSDNGTTFNGGVDAAYFDSVAGLRGLKTSVFEGGIRVPFIATWPDRIKPNTISDLVCAQVDILPTLVEVASGQAPEGIDGVSILPTLTGEPTQAEANYYYWELGGQQAIRQGDWKLIRIFNKKDEATIYLFNLKDDPSEKNNLADQHPDRVRAMIQTAIHHRTRSEVPEFRRPALSNE